ncbi:hypothetical protein M0R45_005300 [Rubus argutus]|uniref:non-specific serine/threonine protein kinase n=1 Tax=Rubus argutus TaxID=59490 RepID=A0AAW1YME7_RUBAR
MERSITWFFLVYCCCCCCCCLASLSTDQSALLALKACITSDPQNMISTNWSTTTPVCNWVGVTCAARHLRVAVLNISYFGLAGTIPPELGNLSFLVDLQLTNNSFSGTLPVELARLRRLKLVSFGYNNFKGEIPSWFGSLPKLATIHLSGNQFTGSIPPAIFNISTLQVINMSKNKLSGSIPRAIRNLTMLKDLYLSYNNFEEFPTDIGTFDQLEILDLQFNSLKGHVPLSVFNMSSLITLSLSRNSLGGNLPDNICQHLPFIQGLYFDENQFDGALPSQLWQCKWLLVLLLFRNNFSGTIPRNIGNLTHLQDLALSDNKLTGTIPDEIGYLQNLKVLALDVNNFKGHIPSTIFNLSSITEIGLTSNQLSGSLPTNIGHGVPNLQQIYVSFNKLNGVIPNSISNASKITLLDMAINSFSGLIPTTLCALPSLQWLNLAQNNLTVDTSTPEANIFSCLPNLRNLWRLHLSLNPLNAMLPVSLGNLSTSLLYFDLSICNMRGYIPNDISSLINLISLELGYNQLTGSIPASIGRLGDLQALYLNDNRFQGNIPDELCQLHKLGDMVLGGNQLSGSIPSCLGNLAPLRTLSLESNLLTSTLPSTLWGLTDILHINLSSNFLIGSLSADIGNLIVVIDIDLSSNNFSGIIPSNILLLENLVNLSLANNNLEGPIPSSFGNLLSLELLDLSKNNLSGVIPKSLEALLHLKYLNLSFNRLHGEIPTGGPFKNFSAQSFFSNDGLCGAPRLEFLPCRNKLRKVSTSVLKYIIPGILAAMFLVTFIWMLIQRKKRNVEVAIGHTLVAKIVRKKVSYQELFSATNGFNETNLLGTGGFGSVYKGILSDGTDIAVKLFNLQLEKASKSFDIECEMLSNVRHRNLIKIISSCNQSQFKALVLDYMPNGSLERLLYYEEYCSLNILERLNIMIDVASALEYLHHGYSVPIVHCDLKPSNILLDDDMVAHVADFGITKLLGGGDSMTETMTLATVGYMAPEYGMEGIVSRRGDVYSFGIVLMESFTKKKPTDEMFVGEMSLKRWVADSLLSDAIVRVVDANLLGKEEDHDFLNKRDCLSSIMRLALDCSAESANERISMQDAAITLHKIKNNFLKNIAAV